MIFSKRTLWFFLAGALLVRLATLGLYPLMDTTESRYGEMARMMVETGNWLTPLFDYDVPFWGKPPLFAWMSAIGVEMFGLSEFTLRVPHWLAGVAVIGLMGWFAKKNDVNPLVSGIILATTVVFSISAGAVMTDMALTLGLSMALVGFYQCWRGDTYWGYVGFIGLAIGLLAKGPVAIVLFGLAVFPWMVLQHGLIGAFVELWKRFPLVKGTLLMLAIALPWYLLAERATPGFLDYFIVGEHYKRFVEPGWEGDLYGSGHHQPKGQIWFFWLLAVLPWSIVLPLVLLIRHRSAIELAKNNSGLSSFLIFWLLSPLLLFTASSNILPTYVLPGTPAIGVLLAIHLKNKDKYWFAIVSLIVPVLLIVVVHLLRSGAVSDSSDKVIFEEIDHEIPALYMYPRSYSGQYYSFGNAKVLDDNKQIDGLEKYYLIASEEKMAAYIAQRPTYQFIRPDDVQCDIQDVRSSGRIVALCQKK